MQKTKLGISVGLLGAIFCFACIFGGYTAIILLAGYILLAESDAWLHRVTVKGGILMLAFSVMVALVNFLPNIMYFINDVFNIFGGHFHIPVLTSVINVIVSILNLAEKVLFLLLGFKALKQETIVIPPIDSFISKYMDN